MPQKVTKYRIVIASPSDVNQERVIANEVIQQINHYFGNNNEIVLESVKWETHTTPGLGNPQENIFNDFGEFDILVGIMWKKIGTPTGVSPSGTVEEFDYAYNLYKSKKLIDIMFYFKEIPEKNSETELEQIGKVIEFKRRVESLSMAFKYRTEAEFGSLLREHLEKKIQSHLDKEIKPNYSLIKKDNLTLNFWNDESLHFTTSFAPNYFTKYQCIPILNKTNQSEKTILEIYKRICLALDKKKLIWIDDNKTDKFNLIHVNTTVLYFLMQLGLDTEEEIIKTPLEYLDSIKENSIDTRAKWFFDIQTNRISDIDCLKFLEKIASSQIKEDVPTKGAFLFSQANTNVKNWQIHHSGGFSFHACHVADVLLHLSSTNEVVRDKAKWILKSTSSFLKNTSEQNNGFLLDINQNKSFQFTIWYYVLSGRLGIPLINSWESNVIKILSEGESNILKKSFLTMNLAILLKEYSQKMKQTTVKSIIEYFDNYHEELNEYLIESQAISNHDLSIFGRALLYCNFAIGNDLKSIYKKIKELK